MEYALPSTWGHGSREFWTKRKKSAASLLAVLALIAGIAVAFKLFDRRVPNNVVRDAAVFDFQVHVKRTASQGCTAPVQGGEWCDTLDPNNPNAIYAEKTFINGVERSNNTFPGDTRTERVRIINTNKQPAKDATFEMYIPTESIVVRRCTDADGSGGTSTGDFDENGECLGTYEVVPDSPDRTRFVNFWNLTVDKEKILRINGKEYKEQGLMDQACTGGVREITKNSPCNLGTIRKAGTSNELGQRLDLREYDFKMKEEDDGTDQSAFKGWTITFDFVFQARVPAVPDSSAPVSER